MRRGSGSVEVGATCSVEQGAGIMASGVTVREGLEAEKRALQRAQRSRMALAVPVSWFWNKIDSLRTDLLLEHGRLLPWWKILFVNSCWYFFSSLLQLLLKKSASYEMDGVSGRSGIGEVDDWDAEWLVRF
ncbi:hypothetical protein H6P81_005527 [Aristolochia fimbriata]|uniref:Uncharacterized protein n=1 Tax=Aristolochia fimbriata TaxID=158543 RepID=A0AAV7EV78_ARIFI|nr:hypothetical protein H6P81_005527 [Aristolochia fimbriata]